MTREEIIAMAREAHKDFLARDYPGHVGQLDPWTLRLLERFGALIEQRAAAAEREACAQIVEPSANHRREPEWYIGGEEAVELLIELAAAIRARGEKP